MDLARFLCGDLRLRGSELHYQAGYSVEDEASLRLESETGTTTAVELSWQRSLGPTFLQIQGERGRLDVGWGATVWHHSDGSAETLCGAYDKGATFTLQMDAFLTALETKDPPSHSDDWHREMACAPSKSSR